MVISISISTGPVKLLLLSDFFAMARRSTPSVVVRNTRPEDFDGIIALSHKVYPEASPWTPDQLASHLRVFPEGQLVAATPDGVIMGMAASLIVFWDDYDHLDDWDEFTDKGYFTNHDPESGMTLYGAEVMVDPGAQGMGIGKKIYSARRKLTVRLGLKRIRAGARLRGYGKHADQLDVVTYVQRVISGELGDPTLSFQLKQGFEVAAVVRSYLEDDPDSRGWAALIEWLNPKIATPADVARRDSRFSRLTRERQNGA